MNFSPIVKFYTFHNLFKPFKLKAEIQIFLFKYFQPTEPHRKIKNRFIHAIICRHTLLRSE